MAAPGAEKAIDITQLPLQQLSELDKQLQQQIQFFTQSIQSLKAAQQKFAESQECLAKLKTQEKEKEMLVPLTSSLYVPGMLADNENVLVDIGTGYHVEMDLKKADAYYSRKVDFLTKEIEKLTPMLKEKYQMKQAVGGVLESKVQAQLAMQQQMAQSS